MDERNHDAQHKTIERFTQALEADRVAGHPEAYGTLWVTFYRGIGVLCALRLDADGKVVPR